MQKIYFLISFVCVLLRFDGIAQESEYRHTIDSISKLLKADKADTTKVKHLNKLASNYSYLYKYDSTLYFGNLALQLNSALLKNVAKTNKTTLYSLQRSRGLSYSIMGNACYDHGYYPAALTHLFTSLKIYENINHIYNIAAVRTTIGLVYYFQGNYDEALKNHFIVLKIYEESADKSGLAMAYNNIGIVYTDQGKLDEALKNHQASLNIKLELGENKSGIAASYNNIGRVLYKQKKFEEAQKNNLICLKLYGEMGDKEGVALSYFNLGDVSIQQKKYNDAVAYLLKAKTISEETHYKANLKFIYSSLTELFEAKKDYKKAYENHKLYIVYRDSLVNEETKEQTLQQQMTYDFEKKEAVANVEHQKEIENQKLLAQEKSRKQNLVIIFVAIGLLLVLVFAGFIFKSLRVTRKQKHIIEQQKHIVEEHQKEIIDSITYAKRLQQAILPSKDEIRKHIPHHFILYQPKDIVAGDFYWMHVVDNLVFIAAADSTGHGVPGAMVSVVCSNALNRAVDEFKLRETGKILDKTRELVLETFAKSGEEIKDGMDISLLCIEKTKQQIYWSGANNPLWYISSSADTMDVINEIKANKQPIGKTDNPIPFMIHTLQFNQGDVFYLMTDGFADQFGGPKGKKYKYKALQEKLIATSHLSMQQQQEELVNSFNEWKGILEQVDDVTIIGIRI